uniref:ATP synthase complex subunit 8 n=1 Tax=Scopimera intermedia TaxID=664711 RepID=A0A891GZX3_9EUCA|nr:ATP synthase F0 subunit 8 [Scopimera intermedia]QRK27400.1 ATP synthase F0 subunit 8 [Scopimera intermedia]
MPQMAPLYWLYLFFFFLSILTLFIMMNYFIKPFSHMSPMMHSASNVYKSWKL